VNISEAIELSIIARLVAASSDCIEQLKKNIPLTVVNIMKSNSKSSIVQKVTSKFCHVKSVLLLWQRLT